MNRENTVKDRDEFTFVSYKRKRKKNFKQIISPSFVTNDSSDSIQNFDVIMSNIQDELKHSDFITHFKEDLFNVFDEWEISKRTILPHDFQTLIKKTDIDILCYGLGQFFSCIIARYQLGFLLVLKHTLHPAHVYVYDPVFSAREINFLKENGLDVLSNNEEGKRVLESKSICFMPHCDLPLYNNLLWANWSIERLSKTLIIGNSLQGYQLTDAKGRLKDKAKFIYLANNFVTEKKIENVFRFKDIFNDLSIHYFTASSLSSVDPLIWNELEEPEYSDDDDLIKNI